MQKLSLEEYLRGTQNAHYPGDNRPDRPLEKHEETAVEMMRSAKFSTGGGAKYIDVLAVNLISHPDGILGVFKDAEGQTCIGIWNEELRAFSGYRADLGDVPTVKVEYNTPDVEAYPFGAMTTACPSYRDEARPIYLSGGRPTRFITRSNASIYTWHKMHDGKMGWVQDPD